MARPQFDYLPQTDEAIGAARRPVALPSVVQTAPLDEYETSGYGEASVPTAEDYARAEAERQMSIARAAEERNRRMGGTYNAELANVAKASRAKRADAAARGLRLTDPSVAAQGDVAEGQEQFLDSARLLGGRTATTRRNPLYHPTQQAVGTQRVTNVMQEPLQQGITEAAVYREQAAAQTMEDVADRQLQAMTQLRANQQAQAQREAAQIERIRHVNDLATKAADTFAKTQDVDPGRYWRSQPAFMKFIAALAAGLKGWAGRTDATSHITDAIAMDIDAQKAAISKASANVGNLQSQAAREESLYGQILAQTGSEREADLIYTKALLEHGAARTAAVLQRTNVPLMRAQAELQLNALRQHISQVDLQLQKQAIASTPTITTVRRNVSDPDVRRLLVERGKAGIKDVSEGRARIGETARGREESQAKIALEEMKGGADSLEERKFRFQQRAELNKGEKAATRQAAIAGIRQYMTDYGEDIPGRTEFAVPGFNEGIINEMSPEGRREQLRRNAIGKWAATVLTGANVSPTQEAFLTDLVEGVDLSGDQIRTGMADLLSLLEAEQATSERALEPRAAAEYRRQSEDELPDYDPLVGGRQRSNTGVEAEAARLGGRLR